MELRAQPVSMACFTRNRDFLFPTASFFQNTGIDHYEEPGWWRFLVSKLYFLSWKRGFRRKSKVSLKFLLISQSNFLEYSRDFVGEGKPCARICCPPRVRVFLHEVPPFLVGRCYYSKHNRIPRWSNIKDIRARARMSFIFFR